MPLGWRCRAERGGGARDQGGVGLLAAALVGALFGAVERFSIDDARRGGLGFQLAQADLGLVLVGDLALQLVQAAAQRGFAGAGGGDFADDRADDLGHLVVDAGAHLAFFGAQGDHGGVGLQPGLADAGLAGGDLGLLRAQALDEGRGDHLGDGVQAALATLGGADLFQADFARQPGTGRLNQLRVDLGQLLAKHGDAAFTGGGRGAILDQAVGLAEAGDLALGLAQLALERGEALVEEGVGALDRVVLELLVEVQVDVGIFVGDALGELGILGAYLDGDDV